MDVLSVTAKEFAGLSEQRREAVAAEAMEVLRDARYLVAKFKAAEAAVIIRQEFPGARWVAFEQGHDGIDASTTIHRVYGEGEQVVLYDLETDEWGEFPDTAAEDFLTGAREEGFSFKERGDLLWLDLIEIA